MYRLERPISTPPSLARVYVEQHPDLQKDHLLASRDPDLQNIHSWHNCQDQDETHLFLTLNVLDILCVLSVTKPILFYSESGSNPYRVLFRRKFGNYYKKTPYNSIKQKNLLFQTVLQYVKSRIQKPKSSNKIYIYLLFHFLPDPDPQHLIRNAEICQLVSLRFGWNRHEYL